ncbi:MAG: isopentenyl phosphate kinase [Anaerolineaceae bacterium]|nr:isopentenyl phosphate kinase [Anaerolineaceae bacterium]
MVFLKLGGSLITDKAHAHVHLPSILNRVALEIAAARDQEPEMRLLLGHGSGSFGHIPAQKFATRQGVHNPQDWQGFSQVWQEARALNQLVIEAFENADLPVVAFPPSACILSEDCEVIAWDIEPLRRALDAHLIPVVNGDVVFDRKRGGTILSTEEIFRYLVPYLHPERILLSGVEAGVWADFPARRQLVQNITRENYAQLAGSLSGAEAVDVTGGMFSKVSSMLSLVEQEPGLEIIIFSGKQPEIIKQALLGASPGTRIGSNGTGRRL